MLKRLTKNQEKVLQVLRDLGGTATAREIADKTKRTVMGISNALRAISRRPDYEARLYAKGKIKGDTVWHLE